MKSIFIPVLILIFSLSLQAQYYYKDIVGTKEINRMIQLYKTNNVQSVTATGYDGDGIRSTDFSETHDFFPDRNILKITTSNKTTLSTLYYRFDNLGRLTSISDSSSSVVAVSIFDFDNMNNLISIKNSVHDPDDSINESEDHRWIYDKNGKPEKMYRIVNKNDTTEIKFSLDEQGNVIEEQSFKKGIGEEKIYYYYDDRNRLTDIVRYNDKAKRLLPDYMFEYSADDKLIQKTTTLSVMGLNYFIWRYVYDAKSLKTKEATFNRDKVMTGKIEYSYRFGK
jgi:antitoxin component YwqK of YwqJK toxin-antitoxin module